MTELGNRLKDARLAKGLSLEDLQSITKIQKRYLIGLEEGNYSSMPGNFYVRAFVKQYSEALQLNPDEIFETYKNEIPATHNDDLTEKFSRVKTRKTVSEGSSKIFDIIPKVLIGVFIIGAAGVLYYFVVNNVGDKANDLINNENEPVKFVRSENLEKAEDAEKDKTKENDKEEKTDEQKTVEETPVVEAPKQELTPVQNSGKNSTYDLKNADKFVVKLVSTGETWVSVNNSSGQSKFQGLLSTTGTQSTEVDLTGDTKAVIVVGRTLDTEIYVNDQKLEYAIAPADVVRQNITIQFVQKNE
ncbi:helix-turn-helix domain-containing protein [Bacillus sp. 7884-1]|uniref:helix-turn-helix domain-containing protein n=1 Tax=Bacillus sp. 7884-1 TaxID=2021693 RepID=UPI000BA51DE0|nr:RodZ domain-containing protein [Bacillus sp. 7884-1]PAE40838.1 helix-turn-helix domain-containing protein [Bacillus sp. 7884-1]